MSRKIESQETDAFAAELVSRALANLPDGPLEKLAQLIDWEQFRAPLLRAWPWAQSDDQRGRPSWDVLLMWKLLIVGKNFGNLSDEKLEEFSKSLLRVIRFAGTRLGFGPDAKTIHKYRSALAESGVMDELFGVLSQQLDAHGYQLQEGAMIDGSLVRVPVQQLTRSEQEQVAAGTVPNWKLAKRRQKDVDARWTKKGTKSYYGYKRHVLVSAEHKLIVDSAVTPAHVHDIQRAKKVLEKVPKQCSVYGDRGYDSAALREHLERTGRAPKIAFRAPRQEREGMKIIRQHTNKTVAKTRARVEHVFGAIQHDMGCTLHRGIGLQRAQSELLMEHLVYNLRRWVFLVGESGR